MHGFFTQNGFLRGNSTVIFGDGRIMLARRIDIRVAKYVRNQVDIAGFAVKIGAEGAAKLVRTDFFL